MHECIKFALFEHKKLFRKVDDFGGRCTDDVRIVTALRND